ncbi:MAG: HD domain-containing protein [Kangiellaceae bacterium]|nr:HD domain-containing protein [Kangiellaceae bacterium]
MNFTLNNHKEYLLDLLLALDGVIQSPKYHPESDALYHSLQVFELAYRESTDPELWLAALFHDVGKSVDSKHHCIIGAEMVTEILPTRVIWIIKHHLDLLKSPQQTQRKFANTQKIGDLIQVRRWDLAGRSPTARVRDTEEALDIVLSRFD